MEALIQAVLYRHTCPSAEQLLDYHLGLLASSADLAVRRHLEICAFCTADLAALFQPEVAFQTKPDQATKQLDILQRLRQLLPNLSLLPMLPAINLSMPTLRGSAQEELQVFHAGDYRLSIAINRVSFGTAVTLEGSLVDPRDPSQPPVGVVHLLTSEGRATNNFQSLDPFGVFTFAAIEPGSYALAIQLSTHCLWIPELIV